MENAATLAGRASLRCKPESRKYAWIPAGIRAWGHIAIYHRPAYVFTVAMPIQPSFRRKPESSVVISYYGNGAGKRRFRRKPE